MKALRKYEHGVGKLRIEEVDKPVIKDDEVLVKLAYSGICGTDMHIYHDTYDYKTPVTIGHEFSGVIVEKGSAVRDFDINDRVVSETNARYCGKCYLCKSGRFCLCNDREALGQKIDGVFANYVALPARELFLIPEQVSLLDACLAEPLSCVVHAIMERSKILPSDTVMITGPGPIGLMAVLVSKLTNARVLLVGTSADKQRLELGAELGADKVFDATAINVPEESYQFTDGKGVDVVIECSGTGAGMLTGITSLKKTGVFTQLGLFGKDVSLDFNKICFKEIDFHGCLSKTDWSWRKTIELLENCSLPINRLISHQFSIDDWEKAFQVSEKKEGLKIIFKW